MPFDAISKEERMRKCKKRKTKKEKKKKKERKVTAEVLDTKFSTNSLSKLTSLPPDYMLFLAIYVVTSCLRSLLFSHYVCQF